MPPTPTDMPTEILSLFGRHGERMQHVSPIPSTSHAERRVGGYVVVSHPSGSE